MKKYPKVLILCNFNQRTANGITIKNLFRHWPKEKVFVADYLSSIEDMFTESVVNYYKIGEKEITYTFPLNLLKKPTKSGRYVLADALMTHDFIHSHSKSFFRFLKNVIAQFQLFLLHITGLSLISKKYHISDEFDNWVCEFDPDIIYTTMGDISNMEFIIMLSKKYKKKLIVHVFDDFVNSKFDNTLFKRYWKKRLDSTFRDLLKYSNLNFVISEKMAESYKIQYNATFHSFHNPIIEEIWLNANNIHSDSDDDVYKIVFTGAVLKHTAPTLKIFIDTIKQINLKDQRIEVQIYTPTSYKDVYRLLGESAENCYKGFVANNRIPEILRNSDALLLTLAFDTNSIKYTKLSMATKVTEYMIAQKPIFLFAPKELAVTEYLEKNNAAYIVNTKTNLLGKISNFLDDKVMQKQISDNAYQQALKYHLSENVSKRMYDLIVSIN
jgi:hypothetical protein